MQNALQRKYNPAKPLAPTRVEDMFLRLRNISIHAGELIAQEQAWSMPEFFKSIRKTLPPAIELAVMGSFVRTMNDYSSHLHESRHQLILGLSFQQTVTHEDRLLIQWLATHTPRERKECIWDYFLIILDAKQTASWKGKEKANCMFMCKHLSHLAYTLHIWYYESLINCGAYLEVLVPGLLADIEEMVITFIPDHLFKIISEFNDLVIEETEDHDPPLQQECQETGRVIEAMISKLYSFYEAYTSKKKVH